MNKLRKFISSVLVAVMGMSASGLGLATTAYAAPIKEAQVQMASVRQSVSTAYTISFKVAGTTPIQGIRFLARTEPSGGSSSVPTTLTTTSATLTSITSSLNGAVGGYTLNNTTNGALYLTNNSTPYTPADPANDVITVVISNITNVDATLNECDSVANTESCYMRISTWDNDTIPPVTGQIDSGVATFTTVVPTLVTAVVDPSLTFTITGVTTTANLIGGSGDANSSCGSSADVVSSATTIEFGNVRVAQYKCAQQRLVVATNAANGYKVYHRFAGSDNGPALSGINNTSNNIDVFSAGSFSTPATWASPTSTTQNIDTGWIGIRTINGGVSTFTSGTYAAPYVGISSAGYAVMDKAGPDLGTVPAVVTFKMEVNAAQPSDRYENSMAYNVVAKY